MAFIKFKVDRNVSRKKSQPKNEAFNSQYTNPLCEFSDALFIINNNYDGELLRMRNHA